MKIFRNLKALMPVPPPPPCPITADDDVRLVAEIHRQDLTRIWWRDLNIDVAPLLGKNSVFRLWHATASDLQFFDPAPAGGQAFYDALRAKSWYSQNEKWEYWETTKWIPPGAEVLEIGAGTEAFKAYIPESRYTALDMFPVDGSPKTDIPPQEQFHVAAAFQVLEHAQNPVDFVQDALAYLKPGGQLFLGVPNRHSYLSQFPSFSLDLPPHHLTRWSEQALHSLADQCGLKVEFIRNAPLEDWEKDLFYMAQMEARLLRHNKSKHWRYGPAQQMGRIASYLSGRILSRLSQPPTNCIGSTLLLRVRKF